VTGARVSRFHGFLLASGALIFLAVVLLGLAVGRFFERHLLAYHHEQVAKVVQTQARQHLSPLDFERPDAGAGRQAFGAFVPELPAVFRIKVYDRAGRIVWSDEPRLIGRTFPDDPFIAKALRGEVAAVLQVPRQAEHEYERTKGHVAETYVPIRLLGSPDQVGVIEVYEDATPLVGEIAQTRRITWGMAAGVGVLLYVALASVVWKASVNEQAAMRSLERSHAELVLKTEELERANRALREAQARLVEKERLAVVGQLVVGLHDAILNPLTGLLGALHLLKQGGLTASATETTFMEAEAEIRKIEHLVRRLPALQRTASTPYVGRTTMLDLNASGPREGGG
jgi:hypothetical protein